MLVENAEKYAEKMRKTLKHDPCFEKAIVVKILDFLPDDEFNLDNYDVEIHYR